MHQRCGLIPIIFKFLIRTKITNYLPYQRTEIHQMRIKLWLGYQDSNLGVAGSKPAALPLGYTPIRINIKIKMVRVKGLEPPRLAAPEPKSGASTNFATPALYTFNKVNLILMVATTGFEPVTPSL